MKISINDIHLERTCFSCPEQYDVWHEDFGRLGYLRLRNGKFTIEYPDCGGELLGTFYPNGQTDFEEEERWFHLKEAKERLINRISKDKFFKFKLFGKTVTIKIQ